MAESGSQRPSAAEECFDTYLRRLQEGATIDLEEWCRAHPHLADELRALAAMHHAVGRLLPGPLDAESDSKGAASRELLDRLRARGLRGARYQRLGEIARGGMGVVLEVWDDELERNLAMKVATGSSGAPADAQRAEDAGLLDRFLEEVKITGQLDHPGIVPVHELGLAPDGSVYYTMRRVQGVDLRAILERVPAHRDGWSTVRVLDVLIRVCEAMSYAHSRGVVHRDLKPANVMVGEFGEVYVMDWGLARCVGAPDGEERRPVVPHGSPLLTQDGDVLGTPAYMAPEQAAGRSDRAGPLADVYSVGAMLYELIGGQKPYVRAGEQVDSRTVLARLDAGPPQSLREIAASASAELVAVCEKAMARAVEDRYPAMTALAADLRAHREGRVVRAFETGAWAEARKWVQRNPWHARTLAGALVLALAAAWAVVAVLGARAREERADRVDAALRAIQHLEEFRLHPNDSAGLSPRSPAVDGWLAHARALVAGTPVGPHGATRCAGLAECRALLAELRRDAVAVPEEEAQRARAQHPRAAELRAKRDELEWRRRMLEPRMFPTDDQVEAQVQERLAWSETHEGLAWRRNWTRPGAPDSRSASDAVINAWVFQQARPDQARVVGNEVLARRLAEILVDRTFGTDRWKTTYRDTLAFALFRVGRLEEAVAQQRAAVEECERKAVEDPGERKMLTDNLHILERETEGWRDRSEKERIVAELEAEARDLELEIDAATRWRFDPYHAWLHEELRGLEAGLTTLERRTEQVERAAFGEADRRSWQEAIAAIETHPRYGGLRITPQVDLVPIGTDPESELWEFAHLPSGERARRGPGGRLQLRVEIGLVFVLIPGTQQTIGPGAASVGPYFLSKYEMTRQQWARLTGEWPFEFGAQQEPVPMGYVNGDDCTTLLRRIGERLPTEVEWEYAARGGKTTRWWTGDDPGSLEGAEQLRPFSNGISFVGRCRANGFGLHDMLGNVSEICLAPQSGSEGVSAGPEPLVENGVLRYCVRGGYYGSEPEEAMRREVGGQERLGRYEHFGLRPARSITP